MKNGEEDADDVQTNNPTPETERERVAKRLREAGASTRRFLDVHDGAKGTTDHSLRAPDDDRLQGNYGIYGGPGDGEDVNGETRWLVDVDVDDYADADAPTEGLDSLPGTFTVESPHTDGVDGGHRYFAVIGDVAGAFKDRFGVKNPSPAWGEVRVSNQYCVGPGSQLDGCDKEWCDECAEPDGGYYRIADDRPIAELGLDEFVEAIAKDLPDPQAGGSAGETDDGEDIDLADFEYTPNPNASVTDVIRMNEWVAEYLHGVEEADDRSDRDLAVCREFVEAGVSEEEAREKMNASNHTKVSERGRDYWQRTWRAAIEKELTDGAHQSWVHEPGDETDETALWHSVRLAYAEDGKAQGRLAAADVLDSEYAWAYVLDSEEFLVYDEETGRYHGHGWDRADTLLEHGLDRDYSTTERDEIIARLKARNQVRRNQLNAGDVDAPLLCVGDGVVNLETGELLDHDPAYYFTRGLAWDLDPADFEPDTQAVLDFMDDITRRVDDRDTLLDHLAHGLIPGHPWRAFVMLYGPGGNGKTQLGEMFMGFVGKQNVANVKLTDLCEGDFATGSLPGKFINIGDDVDGGTIDNLGTLKSLTGSGRILGNAKWESREEFTSEAAFFFSANEPPRFAEDKDSIDDRLYPIRLPYQYKDESEYDPDKSYHKRKRSAIGEELANDEAAMSGLLNLCVEHAQRLFATDGEYSMPEDPAERREIYRAASDPFKRFLRECLTEAGPDDGVLKDDAYSVYTRMCDADDERAMNKDSFKNRKFPEQTVIDYENWRTPTITPGDERQMAYQYVQFTEQAEKYMDERLAERYFGDGDTPTEGGGGEAKEDVETVDAPYNAIPVAEVPNAPTGFATVTVRLGKARDLTAGESMGASIPATDSTGSIPVITWDERMRKALKSVETEHVALRDVEVDEYQGQDQLKALDGTTTIVPIQQGVGYTREERDSGQFSVESFGDVPVDATGTQADVGRLLDFMTDRSEPVTTAEVGEELGVTEGRAEKLIEKAKDRGSIHSPMDGSEGWVTTE